MTTQTFAGPTLEQFEAAREVVSQVTQITPLEPSRYLSSLMGSEVFMKCENLQRTGSYKLRGAYNRLSKLSPEERAKGVIAASAGNHAQGVALAARELGIKATIFMPLGVALPKLEATQDYGAEVVLVGNIFNESLKAAKERAAETGAVFIAPFDHEDIIMGQGTLGLEILEEVPDVDTVIMAIGGGGLISGVASAIKQKAAQLGKTVRIIGVQAENAAAYPPSLEAGEPLTVDIHPTICDGISVARPGTLNFEIIKDAVDEVVTVSDDDVARALVMLLERAKMVVEPAGAVGVAAIMDGKIRNAGKTVTILSGGNIDPLLLQRIVNHGLAASERYLKLRIMLPDRPGQLARTAEIVSEQNANVVEVLHTRHGRGLQISEVELELHIETRGTEHRKQVIDALRKEGFKVRISDDI
jgi:threonine dehydratase